MLLPVQRTPTGASNPTTKQIGYVGSITFPLPGVKRGFINMDYKENIIKMINGIQNQGTLEYLNRFLELFLQHWGM